MISRSKYLRPKVNGHELVSMAVLLCHVQSPHRVWEAVEREGTLALNQPGLKSGVMTLLCDPVFVLCCFYSPIY